MITAARYWSFVDKTEFCWNWTGEKNPNGYGRIDGWGAHRLAYFWLMGDFPEDLQVCHKCDNPSCVRPDHLFIGDMTANMQDSAQKGRAWWVKETKDRKGALNPHHIVTEADVLALWRNPPRGYAAQEAEAKRLGLSHGGLELILKKRRWRHLLPQLEKAVTAQ